MAHQKYTKEEMAFIIEQIDIINRMVAKQDREMLALIDSLDDEEVKEQFRKRLKHRPFKVFPRRIKQK